MALTIGDRGKALLVEVSGGPAGAWQVMQRQRSYALRSPIESLRMAGLIVVKRRKDGGSDIQATEAGRAYAARIIASAAAQGRLFK